MCRISNPVDFLKSDVSFLFTKGLPRTKLELTRREHPPHRRRDYPWVRRHKLRNKEGVDRKKASGRSRHFKLNSQDVDGRDETTTRPLQSILKEQMKCRHEHKRILKEQRRSHNLQVKCVEEQSEAKKERQQIICKLDKIFELLANNTGEPKHDDVISDGHTNVAPSVQEKLDIPFQTVDPRGSLNSQVVGNLAVQSTSQDTASEFIMQDWEHDVTYPVSGDREGSVFRIANSFTLADPAQSSSARDLAHCADSTALPYSHSHSCPQSPGQLSNQQHLRIKVEDSAIAQRIEHAAAQSNSPKNYILKLLNIFYTKEEMSQCNVNGGLVMSNGSWIRKQPLDPARLATVFGLVEDKYPGFRDTEDSAREVRYLINQKCRNASYTLRDKPCSSMQKILNMTHTH